MTETYNIKSLPDNSEKLKILRYAQNTFFRNGFYKITITQLSRELAVSKNTIYKFFPTKDHLVRESIYEVIQNARMYIGEIIGSRSNAIEKLYKMLEILSSIINRFQPKWMSDLQIHMPKLWEEIDEMRRKLMYRNLGKIIEQGRREKLFESYPSDITITIFISSLRAIVNPQFLLNMKETYNEIINYAFEILLNGILTDKGKKIFKQLKAKQK
jgi:AcrR family transcriptional regulator